MDRKLNPFDHSRLRRMIGVVSLIVLFGVAPWLISGIPAQSASDDPGRDPGVQTGVTPDPLMARSLTEKAAIEERFNQSRLSIRAENIQKDPSRPDDLAAIRNPSFAGGILEGIAGPFNSFDVQVSNLWQEEQEDGFIQVFAGALGTDPGQGMLVVLLTGKDRLNSREFRYPSPGAHGMLRITEANPPLLTILAEDGTQYTFDILSGTYSQPEA